MSAAAAPGPRLRVSYVWRDEVMDDSVLLEPQPVTLGPRKDTTFLTPNLGLPERYTILRPGARGYLLTLGAGMTGRMKVGGEEVDVQEWIRRGGEGAEGTQGNFRATSVSPGDWGVIHLDGTSDHSIFFQFVVPDPPLPKSSWRDTELMLPALAFAVILHSAFLMIVFALKSDHHSFVFPGNRELAMNYLVQRPPQFEEPEEPASAAGGEETAEDEPSSTAEAEGKAGGEGERPRRKAPDPQRGDPEQALPKSVQVGLLSERNQRTMDKVRNMGGISEDLGKKLARLGRDQDGGLGGSGTGTGTGVGAAAGGTGTSTRGGTGPGGGGNAHADLISHGPIKTGGRNPGKGGPGGGAGVKEREVKFSTGTASGNLGGLTAEQILKVVRSRQNLIRTCYSRELQRQQGLGGRIVISWRIEPSGAVSGARVRSSTMGSARVEDCIVRVIQNLKFPQPRDGKVALVNFPFIFAQN